MITPFDELKQIRKDISEKLARGEVPGSIEETLTEAMDEYFRRTFQDSKTGEDLFLSGMPVALIAVGGYGRGELCLHSDIDLLLLFEKRVPESARSLVEDMLYPLWNLGMEIGYSVRTLKENLSMAAGDFEVMTTLIDARFICGQSTLFTIGSGKLKQKVMRKKKFSYAAWLKEQRKARECLFGASSEFLEPQLKDGIGGLRDYHSLLWLSKALNEDLNQKSFLNEIASEDRQDLADNLGFLLKTRNLLHQLAGRKTDKLYVEYQERIAESLGFVANENFLSVEIFLAKLHSSMASINWLFNAYFTKLIPKRGRVKSNFNKQIPRPGFKIEDSEIHFEDEAPQERDPLLLIKIFDESLRLFLPLTIEAKRTVRAHAKNISLDEISRQAVFGIFLDIMAAKNGISVFEDMLETGVIEMVFPEFTPIRDMIHFDSYHVFAVGRHLLETLKNVASIPGGENLFGMVKADVEDMQPLVLSALLHDIGKVGKNHAERGSEIVQKILENYGYDKDKTEDVVFLIRHHLLLVESATRKDLNDEKAVVQCARLVGSQDRLRMLLLLSKADATATGPQAWNDWTEKLVVELFIKVLHVLENGELAGPDAQKMVLKKIDEVKKIRAGKADPESMDVLFDNMSPRYLWNIEPEDIAAHLDTLEKLESRPNNDSIPAFAMDLYNDKANNTWRITLLTKDRSRLFSDFTGVLSLNNLNVLSAQIFTWRDSTVVDIFWVTSPLDTLHQDEVWAKVERELLKVMQGKLSLPHRLNQKGSSSILAANKKPTKKPQVKIDSKSLDFFTLIEVFANDRLGLLYTIARTLYELKLEIRVAKIGTKGDLVADTFYVRNLYGEKVEDEEHIEEIKQALLFNLEAG